MDDALFTRIRRIHAAIGATEETDLSAFRSVTVSQPGLRIFAADFRGGMSDEQLANVVQSAIYNVAHFKDHLRRWAKQNQRDPDQIDTAISRSKDLRIVLDLAEADKHGGSRRDGGYSGLNPQITHIDRALRLETRPIAGSMVGLTFAADGRPAVMGDGSGSVLITGSVADANGNVLGDLRDILIASVTAWEYALEVFGISTTE